MEAEARRCPPAGAPQPVVLLSAAYDGTIRERVAVVRGQLEFEVLDPGLHAVPLSLEGIALWTATLDGATAPDCAQCPGPDGPVRARRRTPPPRRGVPVPG